MARTILIVDDQEINRQILNKVLQVEYEVLEAADGRQAMAILEEQAERISAVLLDILMPVMDGYDVLRAMKANPVLAKIPVIVASQRDGDDAEVQALSLGAQDFVTKPYKADILLHRLYNTIYLRETAAYINRMERDELTGLYNRQFFLDKVARTLAQYPDEPYDMLCLGVEHFDLICDTYGEDTGSKLLRFIGGVLLEPVPGRCLCSYFGADVFYALAHHREFGDGALFDRWARAVEAFSIDMDVQLYCGAYTIDDRTKPASVMCGRAQLAAEKNRGKYDSRFSYYDDSIRQQLMEEQFITGSMQQALEQGQFQVYYQPKYDLNSELIAGAEALVRWIHPERGTLSPGTFIPLFEKNGFITRLDQYVWEAACRDIRRWMDQGYPQVAVSVNVSRADLYNPRLADILQGLVERYDIPMRALHLEITESAYTTDAEQIVQVVSRLRGLGFVVEMDDFGSGYSSLNMLADMPVDVLKLDMGFIQNETARQSGRGILSFVISLAKWLDLVVVAEGVETGEQIAVLRALDCTYVQGFYFARPMCREDFEALLRTSDTTEMRYPRKLSLPDASPLPHPGEDAPVMLIVDDVDLNRAVLSASFLAKYRIVEKEDWEQAWDYLQEHWQEVAVVLLSPLPPKMGGFLLLDKIRGEARMDPIPVIVTSQDGADSEQRALNMRADDFISKPFHPDVVRRRVDNVIEIKRLRRLMDAVPSGTGLSARSLAALLKPYFDVVRVVDPQITQVVEEHCGRDCAHPCFAIWGKDARCQNCISIQALKQRDRRSKLEYSGTELYFVSSVYLPDGGEGVVLELGTRLNDQYVDNVMDRDLVYFNLDALGRQLDGDELTGVYNRRYITLHLDEQLEQARQRGEELGLAMVDLDELKHINDTYGHLAGDQALKAVARLLTRNIYHSRGDFVARFGGDEFLVVCRGVPHDDFLQQMEAMGELVEYIKVEGADDFPVHISIGCASLSECPRCSGSQLMERADKRLYDAKQRKQERNR